MSTCAFDTGFDSGFEICTAVVDEGTPDTRYQRGVLAAIPRPRKRPDVKELAGVGYVSVIGAGRLTSEAALEGWLFVPSAGSGNLVRETFRVLIGAIRTGVESLLSRERAVAVSASVATAGEALATTERMASGVGVIPQAILGQPLQDRFVSGRMPIAVGGEAAIMAQESDEAIILMAGALIARLLTD